MGFLTDLGNIFHSIGGFITGNDNQQQQQQQRPQVVAPRPAPIQAPAPAPVQAPGPVAGATDPNTLSALPSNTGSRPPAFNPQNLVNGTLAKAQQQQTAAIPNNPNSGGPTISTFAKDAGSAGAGLALGALRTGEGFVTAANDLPNLAIHAATFLPRKVAGNNSLTNRMFSDVNAASQRVTSDVNTPMNAAEKETDLAAKGFGQPGQDVYEPTQVAGNIVSLVPAGAAVLSKVGEVGNLAKTSKVANAVKTFADEQGSIPTLSKVVKAVANKANTATDITPALDTVADKQPDEIAVGLKSVNPTQVPDAQIQVDNTPAYQRGVPTTVGEATTQQAMGVNNVPAAVSDADARVAAQPAPVQGNQLDIPTFMRNNPDQAVSDALKNLADVDSRIQGARQAGSRSAVFATKQDIADAYKVSPTKGAATARLAAARSQAVDPEAALKNLLIERQQAQRALDQAQAAKAARDSQLNPTERPTPQSQPSPEPATAPAERSPSGQTQTSPLPTQPATLTPPLQERPPEPAPSSVNTSSPNNVPQTTNDVNTAPNAPNVQAGFQRELGTEPGGEHEVMQKEAMQQRAIQNAQNTDLNAAISQHGAQAPVISTPQDAFDAAALMRRMYTEAKDDQASKAARDNLAQAIADYGSRSGQGTNVMADMTANLPPDAKANIIVKSMTRLWGDDNPKIPVELRTLPGQAMVQDTLTSYLEEGENLSNQIAGLEGKLNDIADGKLGSGPDITAQAHAYGRQLDNLKLQAQIKNAEALKYYDSLTPKASITERAAQAARTSMLSGLGGRLNNVVNVGGNTAYELLRAQIQGAIGRAVNAVTGKNAVQTGLINRRSVSGFARGAKTVGAEVRNGRLVDDLSSTIWNKSGGNLSKADEVLGTQRGSAGGGVIRKAGNLVKAAVTTPRNIFGTSVKDSALLRLSTQEGRSMGLTGDELKTYAAARSYTADKATLQKAQLLQDQVAHTNANKFTAQIDKWFNSSQLRGNERGVGMLVKNMIMPFVKFPTTILYNTITDRNVIADAAHLAVSAKRGDIDGVTKAMSGAIIDGSGTALGWHLAHMGLITNKDGNGYSDNGMYLHIGDRYIPLLDIGVSAESLVGGASAALATTGKAANTLENYVKGVGDTILNTFRMAGGQSLVGGDNQSLAAIQNAVGGKNGVSYGDAAAVTGAQLLGQFLPSFGGDVNSVLNYSPLNPSREAADTKVTKGSEGVMTKEGNPSTARDVIPSTVRSLENKVPVLSQTLPRKIGSTAGDFFDRVTRGSHVGVLQATAAKVKADQLSKVKIDLKTGIPVFDKNTDNTKVAGLPKGYSFDNVVNNDIQTGHYQKAMTGLQSQLDYMNHSSTVVPESTKQPIQDRLKQLGVLQTLNAPPALMTTYGSTSLTAWRALGDPTSSTYNPKLYQDLYTLDQALTSQGVSGGNITSAGKNNTPKYYAKTSGSGSGKNGVATIKDNTIRSIPELARENFTGQLTAKPIRVQIPQIGLTPPQGLIKTHKISVGLPRGSYN